jgi:DNA-binding winged helix-turn-helix (wHTH) protein
VKGTSRRSSGVRFGQFELDVSEEKLLKRGLPVRLENQPFQILVALLGRPGEVVGREELCALLWPDGTYVDFDEGLNTAVMKLRYALGDSPESPVFIETVPRRGYRFIAPVQEDEIRPVEPASPDNGHRQQEAAAELLVAPPPIAQTTWTVGRLIALGIIVIAVCALLYRVAFPPPLRVTQITRLTNSGHVEGQSDVRWFAVIFSRARRGSLEQPADLRGGRRKYALWRAPQHQDLRRLARQNGDALRTLHHAQPQPSAVVDAAGRRCASSRG